MLTDAERSRKEKRVEVSKRLLKMGGQNKDGLPESRKAQKAMKEAKEELERQARRKDKSSPKGSSQKFADVEGYEGGGEVRGCGSAVRGTKFKGVF